MYNKFAKALEQKPIIPKVITPIGVSTRLLYDETVPALKEPCNKIPTSLFLAASSEVIDRWGFFSVTKESDGNPSSAHRAEQLLLTKFPAFHHVDRVPDILQWCKKTEAVEDIDEVTQKAISYALLPHVTREQANYLPFLINLWKGSKASKYVGKVGDCITKHLLCTEVLRYNNNATSGYGFKFKDPDNNVYLWWTQKPESLGKYPKGKTFHKAFRVKGHKLWKSTKETLIHYVVDPDVDVNKLYLLNQAKQSTDRLANSLSSLSSAVRRATRNSW